MLFLFVLAFGFGGVGVLGWYLTNSTLQTVGTIGAAFFGGAAVATNGKVQSIAAQTYAKLSKKQTRDLSPSDKAFFAKFMSEEEKKAVGF